MLTRIDGFIIGMNSRLQDTHAQNSGESEFCALEAGCADGLYVEAILNDLGVRAKINLRCDAKAAIALAQRQGLSKRTRHVKVKTNLADIGTKHLPSHRLEFLKSLMGKSSENAMTFRADPGEHGDESDEDSDDGQKG